MLIVVALFTSIGRNLFDLNTPEITLPTLTDTTQDVVDHSGEGSFKRVEITPKTVQTVLASLSPTQSYYRHLSTTLYWGEESSQTSAEIWHHQQISHVVKTLPSGLVRHDIVHPDHVFSWYDGESQHRTAPSYSSAAELAQQIPTYQTVLDLPLEDITQANYQYKEGVSCIFVEAVTAPLFFSQQYWVSIDTGLLVAAETYEGDRLLYKMEGFSSVTSPISDQSSFLLPDGGAVTAP